ncbi:MAG TPA: rod shape-determining protein RodA [Paludibacteraceae bacterium]|nr:rod shape-determining protein RodA [Paludibacteraceae bacterium]HPT42229.1 rod shape-determining protein RodA [Paludibacteraceae bacterium]
MSRTISMKYALDWTTVGIYLFLVFFGWLNVYGASYDFDQSSIFDFSQRAGKQFVWILTAFGLGGVILLIDSRLFNIFSYVFYVAIILLLIVTIFVASDVKGSRSWLEFGPISFQPAELAKTATALALAKFMSSYNYKLKTWKDLIPLGIIVFIPFALIILQKETGSALVFLAFLLMFYREGMNGIFLLLGVLAIVLFVVAIGFSQTIIQTDRGTLGMVLAMSIILLIQFCFAFFFNRHRKEALMLLLGVVGISAASYVLNIWFKINYDYIAIGTVVASCVYWIIIEMFNRHRKYWLLALISFGSLIFCYSADYIFNDVLEPHQQVRIKVLLNMDDDLTGAGYNVNQSKIAIGSGGFLGKGYLNGTQTKLKYVPEQDTDFIFCTVGEEWGFIGSAAVLLVYLWLLLRIIQIAERQRDPFTRIYAYCVASIFFFHLTINVGMVLGIMPVIGIPLPFLSYGGSSLWSFTILLFILLRLDAARRIGS